MTKYVSILDISSWRSLLTYFSSSRSIAIAKLTNKMHVHLLFTGKVEDILTVTPD
jgi:hypothetical protein